MGTLDRAPDGDVHVPGGDIGAPASERGLCGELGQELRVVRQSL
jgi:hypothetical protein